MGDLPNRERGLIGSPSASRWDAWCVRTEGRLTLYGAGLLVSLLLMAVAAIYVTPAGTVINHGVGYRLLADAPFSFSGPNAQQRWIVEPALKSRDELQLRILTPLLAHYCQLRGRAYLFAPLLTGALFLAAIYVHFRKQGFSGLEATGMAALMAFSTPILFLLHFQGYTDTTSYLLLFLTFISIHRAWLWPIFFALSLLNHESNLFLAPLLLLWGHSKWGWLYALPLLALAVVPAALYRHYVQLHGAPELNEAYYLNWERMLYCALMVAQYLPLGIFEAFKLFWVFPLVAVPYLFRHRQIRHGLFLAAGIVCALLQVLLATDTSRLMGLAFPAVLFGAAVAREKWGSGRFVRTLWVLIGFNFLVPQYYIGQFYAIPFYPLPVSLILRYLFGVDAWNLWWG